VSLAQLNARVRARTIVVIEGKRIPWDEYVRQNRKGPKQLKLLRPPGLRRPLDINLKLALGISFTEPPQCAEVYFTRAGRLLKFNISINYHE
jgi:hypothetical protein